MTHKYITPLLNCVALLFAIVIGIIATACNAKDEDTPTNTDYVTTESVAVTGFYLSPDIRIMKNLDSVYFSIDLEHGVIFNADSLPKGTKVTKLVPKISYPSTVRSAVIKMEGGTHREGETNYFTNANDTIDFTGDVTLTLGTANNLITKTYRLKVNVHQTDPDTMYWDKTSSMMLPSRMLYPKRQKSIKYNGGVLSIIEEADGTYTASTTADIFEGSWEKRALNLNFTPVLHTLRVDSDNILYVLDSEGNLLSSNDAQNWNQLAAGWSEIIGTYGTALIGLTTTGEKLIMKSWPQGAYGEMEMPEGFPLTGYTEPIQFTNRWTPDPTIVIFGGYPYPASGKSQGWAFDGTSWVNIADNSMPALSGMSVVSYYSYLNSATNGLLKEFEVYLAFGGRDRNDNINNTVYVSYDHGINWQRAQEYMQLPANIETGYMVDALSLGTLKQSNLSNRWKVVPSRRKIPFAIDGDIVKWECPYIFLFGGYNTYSELYDNIRSGVLQRLTYEPLF